jgi:hypothetical protein
MKQEPRGEVESWSWINFLVNDDIKVYHNSLKNFTMTNETAQRKENIAGTKCFYLDNR